MRIITRIGEWLDHRFRLAAPMRETAEPSVPPRTPSWFHLFGIAALTVFLLQFVADILLALIHSPVASQPSASMQALNHHVVLGWLVRAIYGWGCNLVLAIALIQELHPGGQIAASDLPRWTLLRTGCQKPTCPHQQDHHR